MCYVNVYPVAALKPAGKGGGGGGVLSQETVRFMSSSLSA